MLSILQHVQSWSFNGICVNTKFVNYRIALVNGRNIGLLVCFDGCSQFWAFSGTEFFLNHISKLAYSFQNSFSCCLQTTADGAAKFLIRILSIKLIRLDLFLLIISVKVDILRHLIDLIKNFQLSLLVLVSWRSYFLRVTYWMSLERLIVCNFKIFVSQLTLLLWIDLERLLSLDF